MLLNVEPFDQGIVNQIEAIAKTLEARGHKPITEAQKYGWGGQLSYSAYLNFFAPYSDFSVQHDDPSYSPMSKPYDFLITRPEQSFRIEVKTAPLHKQKIQYCQYPSNPYPKYLVVIKATNKTMDQYDIYGYMLGSILKQLKATIKYRGKKCHSVLVNRRFLDYYDYFHEKILGLPFKEKFSDDYRS